MANPHNIWYSHFTATTPVHADVSATPSPIHAAPATFSVSGVNPLLGTVTVGSGGTYPRFNGAGGVFEAINNLGLAGDLEVIVLSDINELANWTPLYSFTEYCGSDYYVTIRPNDASIKTIEANTSAANAMFSFYGTKRLIIDGSYDGTGRYLRLRHNKETTIYPSTIEFNYAASDCEIRNCIIEGANTNLSTNTTGSVGVLRFGGSMGFASGNIHNITIRNNHIRNKSNVVTTLTNVPQYLIYLGGASVNSNINNIIIDGNDFSNYLTAAVYANNGNSTTNSIGNNLQITNNNIYQEYMVPTYQYPIVIDAVGNTYGHVISGNKIGGNSVPNPDITGTMTNTKTDGEIVAIYLNVGDAPDQTQASTIENNTISNISVTGTDWSNFIGIRVENGRVNILNNLIGSLSSSLTVPNIICNGNGGWGLTDNSMIAGIWTQSTEEVVIDGNTVCGLASTNGFSFMNGIAHGSNLYFNGWLYNQPGGKATITNNRVLFCRSSSALQSLALPSPEGFMGIFCWTNQQNNLISSNEIRNCGSGTSIWNRNVRIHGMFVGVYGSTTAQTGVVRDNEISYLFNENAGDNTGTINPIIYGLSIANGNWTVANNMIYLNNGTQSGTLITERNTSIRGLNDGMLYNQSNCQARYYNNTVYVSGSNLTGSGPANTTYAFVRLPIDYGLISITAGAPIELKNNIFINDRGGLGAHRAIGNIANSNANAAINWNTETSNYNFLSATVSDRIGLWGTSASSTFANWKTVSAGDANSWSVVSAGSSSNTQVSPSDLFVNATGTGLANLRINTAHQASWFVNGKGIALSNVGQDIDGNARSVDIGFGTDIGAHEFTPNAGVLPHLLTASPSANGTNTFTFAGRTLGNITWGNTGTVPSAIDVRYYSGDDPPAFPVGVRKTNFHYDIKPTGGSSYTYSITLNYDDALIGSMTQATNGVDDMIMTKTQATNWIDLASNLNSGANTLTTPGLTSFSNFAGKDDSQPLPVQLLGFKAECADNGVFIRWTTTSEINNDYFTIEYSTDANSWSTIARIPGAGNSNTVMNYSFLHEQSSFETTYYRLSQTDFDGSTEVFQTIAIHCNSTGQIVFEVYPNPFSDYLEIVYPYDDESAVITIIDALGKIVYSTNLNQHISKVNLSGIPAGIYTVQLQSSLTNQTIKLVKSE
jgi:hypothetical protein